MTPDISKVDADCMMLVEEAEARGFARGIEAAARWHDEQAVTWHRRAAESALMGFDAPLKTARMVAGGHQEDATAIRALTGKGQKP